MMEKISKLVSNVQYFKIIAVSVEELHDPSGPDRSASAPGALVGTKPQDYWVRINQMRTGELSEEADVRHLMDEVSNDDEVSLSERLRMMEQLSEYAELPVYDDARYKVAEFKTLQLFLKATSEGLSVERKMEVLRKLDRISKGHEDFGNKTYRQVQMTMERLFKREVQDIKEQYCQQRLEAILEEYHDSTASLQTRYHQLLENLLDLLNIDPYSQKVTLSLHILLYRTWAKPFYSELFKTLLQSVFLPESVKLYCLGKYYMFKGDYENAKLYYKLATQVDSQYAEPFLGLAKIELLIEHQTEKTREKRDLYLKKAIAINRHSTAYLNLGIFQIDDGLCKKEFDVKYFEEALANLNRAIEMDKKRRSKHLCKAVALWKLVKSSYNTLKSVQELIRSGQDIDKNLRIQQFLFTCIREMQESFRVCVNSTDHEHDDDIVYYCQDDFVNMANVPGKKKIDKRENPVWIMFKGKSDREYRKFRFFNATALAFYYVLTQGVLRKDIVTLESDWSTEEIVATSSETIAYQGKFKEFVDRRVSTERVSRRRMSAEEPEKSEDSPARGNSLSTWYLYGLTLNHVAVTCPSGLLAELLLDELDETGKPLSVNKKRQVYYGKAMEAYLNALDRGEDPFPLFVKERLLLLKDVLTDKGIPESVKKRASTLGIKSIFSETRERADSEREKDKFFGVSNFPVLPDATSSEPAVAPTYATVVRSAAAAAAPPPPKSDPHSYAGRAKEVPVFWGKTISVYVFIQMLYNQFRDLGASVDNIGSHLDSLYEDLKTFNHLGSRPKSITTIVALLDEVLKVLDCFEISKIQDLYDRLWVSSDIKSLLSEVVSTFLKEIPAPDLVKENLPDDIKRELLQQDMTSSDGFLGHLKAFLTVQRANLYLISGDDALRNLGVSSRWEDSGHFQDSRFVVQMYLKAFLGGAKLEDGRAFDLDAVKKKFSCIVRNPNPISVGIRYEEWGLVCALLDSNTETVRSSRESLLKSQDEFGDTILHDLVFQTSVICQKRKDDALAEMKFIVYLMRAFKKHGVPYRANTLGRTPMHVAAAEGLGPLGLLECMYEYKSLVNFKFHYDNQEWIVKLDKKGADQTRTLICGRGDSDPHHNHKITIESSRRVAVDGKIIEDPDESIRLRNPNILEELIYLFGPQTIFQEDLFGFRPIHLASQNSFPGTAVYIIQQARQVNKHNPDLYRKYGDGVNATNKFGWTPLICASLGSDRGAVREKAVTETVARLIDYGAKQYNVCRQGRTPLMHAVIAGNQKAVRIFLKGDITKKDKLGRTALVYAWIYLHRGFDRKGDTERLKIIHGLLDRRWGDDRSVSVDITDYTGQRLVDIAAVQAAKHLSEPDTKKVLDKLFRLAYKQGMSFKRHNVDGKTIMHVLAQEDAFVVVPLLSQYQELLKIPTNLGIRKDDHIAQQNGVLPVETAVYSHSTRFLFKCLGYYLEDYFRDNETGRKMFRRVLYGLVETWSDSEIVPIINDIKFVYFNENDLSGALTDDSEFTHPKKGLAIELAKIIFSHDPRGSRRLPLLHHIVSRNLVKTFNVVKQWPNARFDMMDRYGNTLIHQVAKTGSVDLAKAVCRLDTSDAIVSRYNHNGETALHLAVIYNNIDMTLFLAEQFPGLVSMKVSDAGGENAGKTIMHLAFDCQHWDLCRLLREKETFKDCREIPDNKGVIKSEKDIDDLFTEISLEDGVEYTDLWVAARTGKEDDIYKAIEQNADTDAIVNKVVVNDTTKGTILHVIIRYNKGISVVPKALSSIVHIPDSMGWFPQHYAAKYRRGGDMLKDLFKNTAADPFWKTESYEHDGCKGGGETVLHIAVRERDRATAIFLASQWSQLLLTPNHAGETPLQLAGDLKSDLEPYEPVSYFEMACRLLKKLGDKQLF